MAGRRSSVTATLSKTARRFSAAIAPQFTKLEQLLLLQKVNHVDIKISDINQFFKAEQKYVINNAVQFEPIEFDICGKDGCKMLQALLFPDEFVLQEGTKRILAVSFDTDEEETNVIAKIKHPVSGLKVYELVDLSETIRIQACTEEYDKFRIENDDLSFFELLFSCFTRKERWAIYKQEEKVATVEKVVQFMEENSVRVQWADHAENEVRLLALTFGMVQTVRMAYKEIVTIMQEFRDRH